MEYLVFMLAVITAVADLAKLFAGKARWMTGYTLQPAIRTTAVGFFCTLVFLLSCDTSPDLEGTAPGMGADTTVYQSDRGIECSFDSLQRLILKTAASTENDSETRRLAGEQAACLKHHVSLPVDSGLVAIGRGDLDEAAAGLHKGLKDADGNSLPTARIHSLLGITHSMQGDDSLAIVAYDSALTMRPDHSESWYFRGMSLARSGRNEEALASFDSSLERGRDHYDGWLLRARALTTLGRIDEAIASYDRALALKGDLPLAWSNRGTMLDRLGRYEEAIHSYDSAIAHRPDFVAAWFNRSVALSNLGRTAEALAGCDSTLRYNPGLTQAKVLRQMILQKADN